MSYCSCPMCCAAYSCRSCCLICFSATLRKASLSTCKTLQLLMCTGVGIKQVSNVKQMLGKLTTLDSNNYPEMLGKTCIINAPPGFNMMFGMIKPFLDVRTRAKVEVSKARLW